MQSNQVESGGLNFVFESGSSGRENKKYVRSHAAKVGWSQRSRKQAQSASKDDVALNQDFTPKKRRKTTHQSSTHAGHDEQQLQPSICSPRTQPTVNRPVHFQAEAGAEVGASTHSRSSSSLATQHPPQQHGPARDAHFTAYPASLPPAPAILASAYTSGPTSSSSSTSSHHFQYPDHQYPGHPASARAQEVETSSSTRVATSVAPAYSPNQAPSYWHARPDSVQHDSVAQHSSVPLFRPAASPVPIHPREVTPGVEMRRPVPPTGPLPSARLPPLENMHVPRPSVIGANWRQYDNMTAMKPEASQPSTPASNIPRSHEENDEASSRTPQQPSPKRTSKPAFLELVLNEDYPMWKNVDSGSDSFGVFPVKWQPFYGRLVQNYRSNMLVQLDEILTDWTEDEKLEFNQMPLRLAGSEPALFYSLLATAAIMMPPGLISPSIPRWLQTRTVECLNQAFSDPKRAYSDAIILSLNMVSLFESCSGHGAMAATTHQPILRRMVDARGGLSLLAAGKHDNDQDSKNLVRFLAWTDRVIRCQTGNALMFEAFREEASVTRTDWEGIWKRTEKRLLDSGPLPVEEVV